MKKLLCMAIALCIVITCTGVVYASELPEVTESEEQSGEYTEGIYMDVEISEEESVNQTEIEEDISDISGNEEEIPEQEADEENGASEDIIIPEETVNAEETVNTDAAVLSQDTEISEENQEGNNEAVLPDTCEDEHSYVNGVCENCKNINDGFALVDGIWGYYTDGVLRTDVTGLVEGIVNGEPGWWYVREGLVMFTDTLVKKDGIWWAVINGKADPEYTGFASNENGTYYFENGLMDFSAKGIFKGVVNGIKGWWYVSNSKVKYVNTFASNDYGWWYVSNGMVDTSSNGIFKGTVNGIKGWWYVKNGKVKYVNTFASNDYGWWYVSNGMVDVSVNSVIKGTVNGIKGWWYVKNGKVKFVNTFAENENGWWYLSNGMVDFATNSVIKGTVNGIKGWWYVKNSKVKFVDTIAKNQNGWWYINKGMVDFDYKGFGTNSNGTFYFKDGKLVGSMNAVIKEVYNGTEALWYIKSGKLRTNYTGWINLDSNWYYIVDGKAFTGSRNIGGVLYTFYESGVCTERYPYIAAQSLAASINNQLGRNLYSSFMRCASGTYLVHSIDGISSEIMPMYCAVHAYTTDYGDCYCMASSFYYLAKDLGLNAHLILGQVPLRAGGLGAHAWVEIDYNGYTRVYDPQFRNQYGQGGYEFYYGQSGTWMYQNYYRFN
ncbi:MAG: hypothetical protein HUJ76_09555 [Parasporobacterium sp.]|nr:hypothetical protein [Parasporobacterium sp.]